MALRPAERLDSWKQIAAYLNRSVRTVRRWEREEGLPVHRHMHRALGSVFALRPEIDAWRQSLTRAPEPAAPADASIAVLPFTDLSDDADSAYFVEGLTEEITTTLSRVRALRVISRASAASLRGTRKRARGIARELGVRYLLQGSVRKAQQRLRISAQLINAAEDVLVWGEVYDGTLEDVFTIQEQLARIIVAELEVRLTTGEDLRLSKRPIASVPAYECYLRARHESWRWRQDSIDRSVRLLQQGLSIVGDNAQLYAALGLANLQYREAGVDLSPRPLRKAQACAAKVLALDPASATGLQLRGWIAYSRGRIQQAVRDLKACLAREPNNADTLLLLSNCYLISGQVPASRPLLRRLLAIDPLTPISRCMPAFADLMEGRLAAAVAPYHQMLDMDVTNPMARLFYAWVLILNGRTAEGRSIVAGFPEELRHTLPARVASFLVRAAAREGRTAQALVTAQIEALAGATDVFPRLLAQGFALAGLRTPALKWLRVAIGRGFINYPFLAQHDPSLEALRGDARFQRLLVVVRKRWEKFEP